VNETQSDKKNTLTIAGLVVLIALLVLGIQGIFLGLERVMPNKEGTTSQAEISVDTEYSTDAENAPTPSYCTYCGEKLPESFQWGQFCPYCGQRVEWENAAG
jgi:predicted RNA-binding Zn-ribbon protein involved in translation (DUF1610 family)